MACPEPDMLTAFSRGGLPAQQQRVVETHLDYCEACSWVVSELARVFTSAYAGDGLAVASSLAKSSVSLDLPSEQPRTASLEDTLADDQVPPPQSTRLRPGRMLDRYHILEEVGSGGMGVVYAAYDPGLDRKVALKVLHDRSESQAVRERAQRRLTREAQAMARLSHPNVITVHEVRTIDDRVFVSMEFVEGGTLGDWCHERKRSVEEIVKMFCAIGRGLAAAHAAGLVHRDIKPDNVLIGRDDRPRVTDFGLARPTHSTGDPIAVADGEPPPDDESPPDAAALRLSRTKGLVGTPAYMPPEQLLLLPATPASDQFSFCVALFEALFGYRPFAGQSFGELSTNVLDGKIRDSHGETSVPRWLRQIVLRGLSREPEQRWPSMELLVEQLHSTPRRRKARLLVAGGLALAVLGGGLATSRVMSAPADPCEQQRDELRAQWTDGARGLTAAALSLGPTTYAKANAERVVRQLDDYVEQWSTSHHESCVAYHRAEQSDEAFDLRSGCFDERRRELVALLDVLQQDDEGVRRHARQAVDQLVAVSSCNDLEALRSQVEPPDDAATRGRVQQLDTELARVRALVHAGQYEAARALANEVTANARAIGYAPAIARALFQRATAYDHAGDYAEAVDDLREAWPRALAAGDDPLAAEAVVSLAKTLGHQLAEYELAALRMADAEAMIERVRRRNPRQADRLSVSLWFAQGRIELRHHRYDEALAQFRRALELAERNTDPSSLRVAAVLNATASARLARGDQQQALALYERVLEIRRQQLGPQHPETGHARNNAGLTLKNMGRLPEAADQLRQARTILEASLPLDHPSVAMTRLNLAETLYGQRNHAEAAPLYVQVYGDAVPEDLELPHITRRYLHYGSSLVRTDQVDRGRRVLTSLLDVCEARKLDAFEAAVLGELARTEVTDNQPELALRYLERMHRLGPVAELGPGWNSEVALSRARALAQLGQPTKARALMPQIRADLGRLRSPSKDEVDAFEASLDEH